MTENEVSYKIRNAIFKIYNELGPVFLVGFVRYADFAEKRRLIRFLM
jgi:hypothetical protein